MTEAQPYESFDQYMRERIANGFIKEDGTPIKCEKCGCTDYTDETIDRINGHVCESYRICVSCGGNMGHWAYGHWQV